MCLPRESLRAGVMICPFVEEQAMKETCPNCSGQNVKPMESWEINDLKVTDLPKPMWASTEPTYLHKWPRESTDYQRPSTRPTRSATML